MCRSAEWGLGEPPVESLLVPSLRHKENNNSAVDSVDSEGLTVSHFNPVSYGLNILAAVELCVIVRVSAVDV